MALLQSFLEKNESISEIICLSLTIAFSIESFLIALKDTHFLRNTELKAILFYLRNLNQYYNSTSEKYDYIGNSICGNSQYDIAKHLWGGNWQLPSKTDFEELVKNCTMQWSNIGGVRGIMFYGKNDNSIFLPAGGARQHDNIENYCTYGTGTLSPTAEEDVYAFVAEERYGCDINTRFRFWGQSIRPVMK